MKQKPLKPLQSVTMTDLKRNSTQPNERYFYENLIEFKKLEFRPYELKFFRDKNLTSLELEIVSQDLSNYLKHLWSAKNYGETYKNYNAHFKDHGQGLQIMSKLSETSYLLQDFFRLPFENRQLLEPKLRDLLLDSLEYKISFILNDFSFCNRGQAYSLVNSLLNIIRFVHEDYLKISRFMNISWFLNRMHEGLLEGDTRIENLHVSANTIFVRKISKSEKLLISIDSKTAELEEIIDRLENLENK